MHSTVSDGWRAPDEVAHLAADRGVRVMALTDHDTFLGVERARSVAHRRGLGYVPALEVTTYPPNQMRHILGHGVDPHHPQLRAILDRTQSVFRKQTEAWIRVLQEQGIGRDLGLDAFAYKPTVIHGAGRRDRRHPRGRRARRPRPPRVGARPGLDERGPAPGGRPRGLHPPAQTRADPDLRGAGRRPPAADDGGQRLPRLQRRRLRSPQEGDRHPLPGATRLPGPVAGRGESGVSPTLVKAARADARAALLELGGRESTVVAAAIEGLPSVPAFQVMATASQAARPQWAGLVDDLFERPMLKQAKAGLRNALMSTLTGETLYRNVFFSFADTVILWHYGYTQERTGSARLDAVYSTMRRLLAGAEDFMDIGLPAEPDIAYFHRLRRIRLTRDNAYPMLRRAGRLLGAGAADGPK